MAHALEALGVIATAPPPPRAQSLSPERAALRGARTCYDHLAGALAVALVEKMERERVLFARVEAESAYEVTPFGVGWLADAMQIDVGALAHGRARARPAVPRLDGAAAPRCRHAVARRCSERMPDDALAREDERVARRAVHGARRAGRSRSSACGAS